MTGTFTRPHPTPEPALTPPAGKQLGDSSGSYYKSVSSPSEPGRPGAVGSPSGGVMPLLGIDRADRAEAFAAVVGERYDVLRTLGMGGVGMVYLVREKASGELYALKVLRPALRSNPEVIARFRREVEIARRIHHPNVAAVQSFNEVEGHLFIVMQYIDGVDLSEFQKTMRPALDQKLAILKAICSAVDAAHQAGVVHRDLKPANIRVAKDGTPYVLDFGVAATEEGGEITRLGAFIGTPLYVSPEQAQGKRVDHRSDIYSLGAIFYELVAGRPPFIGESPITIALKHIREAPFRPRSLNPDLPPVVERVILKCLEKDPKSRPQRASDIIREIEEPLARELEAAKSAARTVSGDAHSGELRDVSLFQYLRVLAPIRRNFVLEIVNNDEFGRYHFRGAHLVHAESGNLRDEEVAYNLFYWTRGIFRVITDAEPPAKETVSIPWIPFVERYFDKIRELILPVHGIIQGPVVLDLLDPKGSSVYRYSSDAQFEKRIGERAQMPLETFQKARTHLKSAQILKVSKSGDDGGTLFCFLPGLRHYFYAQSEPRSDVDALYRWIKNDLEPRMIEALHDCMRASDKKGGGKGRGAKVLLAENEDFLGNLVRIKLRTLGMDVHLVRDGSKAVEVAKELRPDVILLSTRIPGISGYDVCRMLAATGGDQAPIVLLAPAATQEVMQDVRLPGVVRVLEKPLVLDELVEVVQRYSARGPLRAAAVRREPVAAR